MLSTNFGTYKSKLSATAVVTLSLILGDDLAQAQIASDGTTNTQVQVRENTSLIKGGTQNGANLFHSFQQFSLATDGVADFSHSLEVKNIFSRVTGGLVSELDGLIKTQGNANLFLLNPAGVVFGANAQLNVGGSFIVSTGDRIIFADGTEFGTSNPKQDSLLTISSPVGLQYGINPGNVTVLPNAERVLSNPSGLNIQPERTLALLGGDVSIIRNSLNGQASNIEISSVKSGQIGLEDRADGWQFNYDRVEQLGKIDLNNRALIINNNGVSNFLGSTISLSKGSGIINATNFSQAESSISLRATESIDLNNSSLASQVWQQSLGTQLNDSGAGGSISLNAPKISLSSSFISAAALREEPGGSITINAGETFELLRDAGKNPSVISTSTEGLGNGGDITINTAKFTIKDGSQIQSFGGKLGSGGQITVNASDSVDLSGTGISNTQDLTTGNPIQTTLASGFSASTGVEGSPNPEEYRGNSGNLVIATPKLNLSDRGQISVGNFGLGNGGDIQISTTDLALDTEGKIIANTVSGNGGSINITAEKLISLDAQSAISTTAANKGNGGRISIVSESLLLLDSNKITADAQQGSGGKIGIDTQVLIADPNSSITANSEVNQNQGIVKIETLDLNSRLQTQRQVQAPLKAENYIQRGCGVGADLDRNQFRNVGRGGIANNPLQESTTLETLEDLDTDKNISSTRKQIKHKKTHIAIAKLARSLAPIGDAGVARQNPDYYRSSNLDCQ